MILHTVRQFIEQEQLVTFQEPLLLALSGGADSVALFRILLHLGYSLEAAHCNFHLRGAESERDKEFVRKLCQSHQVFLHTIDFDTRDYATKHHLSIEMAARELRYTWFEKLSQQRNLAKIAVAHHWDDSIETFLLNLIRGTGIAGLTGIRPVNGKIIRPLLCIGRTEIIDYLHSIGQPFMTDSSNLSENYTRNKIRNSLLPLLESFNPSFRKGLIQTSRHLSEAEAVYKASIDTAKQKIFQPEGHPQTTGMTGGSLSISALLQEPSPAALLHEILFPYGFVPAQVRDIIKSLSTQSGKIFRAGNWTLLKDRSQLIVYKETENPVLPEIRLEEFLYEPGFIPPKDTQVAYIDADQIQSVLTIRKWKKGDWFIPFGMSGRKLVSDFLTDLKKNLREKQEQLIVTDGDQIVWIAGERLDHRYRITEKTKRIYRMTLHSEFEK